MIAAGLLAQKAVEKGLTSKPWAKTTLGPGSKVVTDYYEKSGLDKSLEALGFYTVGYGCTICIGNSGPLIEEVSTAINDHDLAVTAVLSGNRNFEGRISPDVLGDELPFETVEASATFDRVLFDGGEFGTGAETGSAEEEDFLGLPGLLEPDQVAVLLRKHQADQQAARRRQTAESRPEPALAPHEEMAALRKELNGLVGAWNHRTGQPHGVIHADLRRSCGGPAIAQASAEEIRKRIDTIRKWATQRGR
jgi:hypothetical protein